MRFARQIPNALTVIRLCCLPVFVILYAPDAPHAAWPAAAVVFFGALTDTADGFIARRYHFETEFGRVLDPFVDRAAFATLLITMLAFGTLPWWAVVPIVFRDVIMLLGGAALMRFRNERPRVMRRGKFANLVLVLGILFFVIGVRSVGWVVYAVGGAMYLWVGVLYVLRALREYRVSD
jgi:CDP-diacylglycerol--glycerol-3-phosphate 3-phosphatidyltransferase